MTRVVAMHAPVTYQGAKGRLAGAILDVIQPPPSQPFHDLCCGSGAVAIEAVRRGHDPRRIVMVDASPWGLVWEAIGNGIFDVERFAVLCDAIPPDPTYVKAHVEALYVAPVEDDAIYIFLILQAAAIGGKAVWIEDNRWWRSSGFRDYWLPTATSSRRSPVNPMMPMPATIVARMRVLVEQMNGVHAMCDDAAKMVAHARSGVAYIDPPYMDTTGFGYTLDVIDLATALAIPCWVSEGRALTPRAVQLSTGEAKGGVTGERRKAPHEEWLSYFDGVQS